MSLTIAVALNAILAGAVVTALAAVCRIPYRLDRISRARVLSLEAEAVETIQAKRAA